MIAKGKTLLNYDTSFHSLMKYLHSLLILPRWNVGFFKGPCRILWADCPFVRLHLLVLLSLTPLQSHWTLHDCSRIQGTFSSRVFDLWDLCPSEMLLLSLNPYPGSHRQLLNCSRLLRKIFPRIFPWSISMPRKFSSFLLVSLINPLRFTHFFFFFLSFFHSALLRYN